MRVLVVEDERRLADLIARGLREAGYTVDVRHTGSDGLLAASTARHDSVVLDVMLPGLDGLTVCRRLRDRGLRVPVLILTARGLVPDRVAGTEVDLPAREFDILRLLMARAGHCLTRYQILDEVWDGETDLRSNVIDVYIASLRAKVDKPFGRTPSKPCAAPATASNPAAADMLPPLASKRRLRRGPATWNRFPLRVRLVAGFAAAMLLVLTGAGAFVYLRVQYALDLRLNEDLTAQSTQLVNTVGSRSAPVLPPGMLYQLLDLRNQVVAASDSLIGTSLLTTAQTATALHQPLRTDRGGLFPINGNTLRLYAVPIHPGGAPTATGTAVAVVAVRRDQALRELIGQLILANLAALAIASLVGYRVSRAALTPVERYRTEAARITAGATGVRLAVPADSHDEIARLGHTLNTMLAALGTALERERRFVEDASHELRTPLTLLAGELELALRRPRTPAELEQTVKGAAADTADLIRLADALLTVGVQPDQSHAAAVDLRGILTGLVTRYRSAVPDGAPELHVEAAADLTVHGDATRLEQVVTNVLDNAARPGAPRLCSRGVHHRSTERFGLDCSHPDVGTTLTVLLPAAGSHDELETPPQ